MSWATLLMTHTNAHKRRIEDIKLHCRNAEREKEKRDVTVRGLAFIGEAGPSSSRIITREETPQGTVLGGRIYSEESFLIQAL